jgi:hypothetical protein
MVRTNASSQFQDDPANRLVISWFNRLSKPMYGGTYTGATTSTSPVEITPTTARVNYIQWANEGLLTYADGTVAMSAAGGAGNANVYIDGVGTTWPHGTAGQAYAGGAFVNISGVGTSQPIEGFHYLTLFGWSSSAGNTCTYNVIIGGMIRG